MSTAFFIVLDSDEPGFDPFVDGKFLTKHLDGVNVLALQLGLKELDQYACQDLSEFGGPAMEPVWFDAQEGIHWVSTVAQGLQKNVKAVDDAEQVLEDLDQYLKVFEEAQNRKLRWHLELDF